MAVQANQLHNGAPIVRPLPEKESPRGGCASCASAEAVLRTALFAVDANWYEAHWYREPPNPKQRFLSSAVTALRGMIAAVTNLRPAPARVIAANAIDHG